MRLDKFLAGQGLGTRTEVKKLIKSGIVTVDGNVVTDAGFSLSEDELKKEAVVFVGEREVSYQKFRYYMLNKPAGVLTATKDAKEKTVMDLFTLSASEKRKLFPVGRLDKDTEGLLLVTDDGELAHALLSPKRHVDKCYFAIVDGIVTAREVEIFAAGVELDFKAMPAGLEILSIDETVCQSSVRVTLQEGKYHQVKRMLRAVGNPVRFLKRISMGSLCLDASLKPGEFRELTEEEVLILKQDA